MNKIILMTISTLLTFNTSFAQESNSSSQIMRMVCMKTLSTGGYTGKVYVIEQVNPDIYDGSVFSENIPRQNGEMVLRTDMVPFRVTIFPQVDGLRGISDYTSLGNELLNTVQSRRSSVVDSMGYRMHMGRDHHYFFSLNPSGSDYIRHDVDNPEGTHYQHGEDGGRMECQSPYSVAFNSAPEILDEEQTSDIVTASYVAE